MFHIVKTQMNNSLLLLWSALLTSSFFSAEVVAYAPPVINTWIRFVIASLFLFPLVAKQIKAFLRWRYAKKVLLALSAPPERAPWAAITVCRSGAI